LKEPHREQVGFELILGHPDCFLIGRVPKQNDHQKPNYERDQEHQYRRQVASKKAACEAWHNQTG
jgi:hypothetical protein